MAGLFAVFDPQTLVPGLRLNWASLFIIPLIFPSSFWTRINKTSLILKTVLRGLRKELKLSLGLKFSSRASLFLSSIFIWVVLTNLFRILPYVFAPTSHLSVTLSWGGGLWIGYWALNICFYPRAFFRHLVPAGTPFALVPFIVLIELRRQIIRPMTLSIRLAANISAGHLIIVLVRMPAPALRTAPVVGLLGVLSLITLLELAVAIIQAYVFVVLTSLYIRETKLY